MLGPWCQPLVVQFSRLLTTLTMAWDPDVRNPLGGAIFYWLEIKRTSVHTAMTLVGPCCHPLHVQSSPDCVRVNLVGPQVSL